MYSGKLAVDKDWENVGRLFVISGDWMSPHFDSSTFPLVNKFTRYKSHSCSVLLFLPYSNIFPFKEMYITFKILVFFSYPYGSQCKPSQKAH